MIDVDLFVLKQLSREVLGVTKSTRYTCLPLSVIKSNQGIFIKIMARKHSSHPSN